MAKTEQKSRLERWLPYILIIAGIVGVLAAFIITQDKIKLLENPNYKPACSINPIISCGTVMQSAQSHVFGFANPYIGLVGFPVLITLGVLMLSGVQFKRWIWLGLNAGLLFGLGFVHWLFYQSVWHIHALCPYCMAVWVVTITAFWYVTLYNLQQGYIKLPARLKPVGMFARKHHLDILVLWFIVIAGLILHHFWYYFGRHLPF